LVEAARLTVLFKSLGNKIFVINVLTATTK
jgi:hypothetical protein